MVVPQVSTCFNTKICFRLLDDLGQELQKLQQLLPQVRLREHMGNDENPWVIFFFRIFSLNVQTNPHVIFMDIGWILGFL